MTTVVNIRKDPYDVYIGRGSIYGNEYSHLPKSIAKFKTASLKESLEKYEADFNEKIKDEEFRKQILKLKDKRLGCFCAPKKCHGDVIAKYLNSLEFI
jgi:uncharacterized FlgJ-related protein